MTRILSDIESTVLRSERRRRGVQRQLRLGNYGAAQRIADDAGDESLNDLLAADLGKGGGLLQQVTVGLHVASDEDEGEVPERWSGME